MKSSLEVSLFSFYEEEVSRGKLSNLPKASELLSVTEFLINNNKNASIRACSQETS